jgi:hypothetical protein
MVLYATPFREVPGTRNRRGFGDAMSSAQDGLNQLAPLQVLIDQSPSGAEATDNAQAAMLALTADLNAIKTAGPTDVFAPAPTFNSGSFLAGLGLALVGSALLYLAIDNSSPQRRPSRRRRTA